MQRQFVRRKNPGSAFTPPHYASPAAQPAIVLADDLTGANDTGVQFAGAGSAVRCRLLR